MSNAKTEAEALYTIGPAPVSPCTCWMKAPTVPVFRDRHDHLNDCPLKGSGLPVGVAHTSLVDQATRLKEVVAENEQLRGLLKHLRLYFAAERACHIEDRRPTHCEDMELERIDKALQEPPR